MPPQSDHLRRDLLAKFDTHLTSLPGDLNLNLALKESESSDEAPEQMFRLIWISANQIYELAQALIGLVFEYFGEQVPEAIAYYLQEYLGNAVATGSTIAASKLRSRSYEVFEDAKRAFQCDGGSNQDYSHISFDTIDILRGSKAMTDRALLSSCGHGFAHYIYVYGSCEDLDPDVRPAPR